MVNQERNFHCREFKIHTYHENVKQGIHEDFVSAHIEIKILHSWECSFKTYTKHENDIPKLTSSEIFTYFETNIS